MLISYSMAYSRDLMNPSISVNILPRVNLKAVNLHNYMMIRIFYHIFS